MEQKLTNEQILAETLEGLRTAMQRGDNKAITEYTQKFIAEWNKDVATNLFNNSAVFREFCGVLELCLSKQQGIVLDKSNIQAFKFLPAEEVAKTHFDFADKQDPKLWASYIDWLIKERRYEQLVNIAATNNGEQFDKIQDALLAQHDEPECVLHFVKKYRERANVAQICYAMSEYMGRLSYSKIASVKKKYQKVKEINDEIYSIKREIEQDRKNKIIEQQMRR